MSSLILTQIPWPLLIGCFWISTLAGIDLLTGKLPNILTYSGMVLGWGWHELQHDLGQSMIGGLWGFAIIFIINITYQHHRGQLGMGWGDAKMLAMLGSWLGPSMVLPILAWACILGSGFVLLCFSIQIHTPSRIPFGPWLALGTAIMITR